jgi:hypothetical protein
MEGKSKISKAKGVEICTELLQNRKSRKEILQEISKSYKVSDKTVDNWMKEARVVVQGRQQEAESIRLMHMDAAISDGIKEGLLSDMEIELILCKIISGDVKVEEFIKGNAVLREVTPTEITNAAKVIYAKRGSNAASKIEHSGKVNLSDEPIIFE